ncbi:MAG: class I SAM-dependent methyltransferase [Deltaproteobacteria bacterium]|nr:MAG: class I SAM-dependent methyltransferase [Deltaproteobacteria bacterium]
MSNLIPMTEFRGSQATAIMALEPKVLYAELVPQEEWILNFSKAREIYNSISGTEGYSFIGNSSFQRRSVAVGFAVRAKGFEDLIDKYLGMYEDPVLIQFGCGLSDRSERYRDKIDNGLPFYDIDFPDMIEFRRTFYQESSSYKMIASDLSNYTWLDDIPNEHKQRQCIFVAEGVTPYLKESQLKELFATLAEHFPGCLFIFDTYSEFKLKDAKRSLKKKFGAEFHFYNNDPQDMVAWGKDGEYKFLEEDNLLLRDDFLHSKHLPALYRGLMKMFARWFTWSKGIMRSTVVQVFQLG